MFEFFIKGGFILTVFCVLLTLSRDFFVAMIIHYSLISSFIRECRYTEQKSYINVGYSPRRSQYYLYYAVGHYHLKYRNMVGLPVYYKSYEIVSSIQTKINEVKK